MAGVNPNIDLAEAVRKKNVTAAGRALNAGASPDATFDYMPRGFGRGVTVLMLSMSRTMPRELAGVLIGAGANVNAADARGYTPTHWAAGYGDGTGMRSILAAKPDLNARDVQGRTPLHTAVEHPHDPINVQLLLEAGADKTIQDNDGKTPLDLALEKYRDQYMSLQQLRAMGARPDPISADKIRLLMEAGAPGNVTQELRAILPPDLQRLASAAKRNPMLQMRDYLLNRAPDEEREAALAPRQGGKKTRKRTRRHRKTHGRRRRV